MNDSDITYYTARMRQEMARARDAIDPVAATAHRQLAEEYRARLETVPATAGHERREP